MILRLGKINGKTPPPVHDCSHEAGDIRLERVVVAERIVVETIRQIEGVFGFVVGKRRAVGPAPEEIAGQGLLRETARAFHPAKRGDDGPAEHRLGQPVMGEETHLDVA